MGQDSRDTTTFDGKTEILFGVWKNLAGIIVCVHFTDGVEVWLLILAVGYYVGTKSFISGT